jgi:hypothetical protein
MILVSAPAGEWSALRSDMSSSCRPGVRPAIAFDELPISRLSVSMTSYFLSLPSKKRCTWCWPDFVDPRGSLDLTLSWKGALIVAPSAGSTIETDAPPDPPPDPPAGVPLL